jgi:hypothetical protein
VIRKCNLMNRKEKDQYAKLISLEVNSYLDKIYKTMKSQVKLRPVSIMPEDIIFRNASFGSTKAWEFRLNRKEEVARGEVGSIVMATAGIDKSVVRKQRALFIAAEFYVYHAFANHKDPSYFDSIKGQNQYGDMVRKLFGRRSAHEIRDHAVQYVIEDIREHALAHLRAHGWFVSLTKLNRHYPDIAKIVGSSEKTFKEIFRKQHQKFTHSMLKQEEDLVRKEIEDIDHLIKMLKSREDTVKMAQLRKMIRLHLANLRTFRKTLDSIHGNLDRWVLVDKKEHALMRKRKHIPREELHDILAEEARAEKIDINRVHLVFNYFEKEKINILNDLEMVDKMSASARKKRR